MEVESGHGVWGPPSVVGPASTASVPVTSGTPLVMRHTVNGEPPPERNSQSCRAFEL